MTRPWPVPVQRAVAPLLVAGMVAWMVGTALTAAAAGLIAGRTTHTLTDRIDITGGAITLYRVQRRWRPTRYTVTCRCGLDTGLYRTYRHAQIQMRTHARLHKHIQRYRLAAGAR